MPSGSTASDEPLAHDLAELEVSFRALGRKSPVWTDSGVFRSGVLPAFMGTCSESRSFGRLSRRIVGPGHISQTAFTALLNAYRNVAPSEPDPSGNGIPIDYLRNLLATI